MKKEIEIILEELSIRKAEDILLIEFEEGQHPITDRIIVVSSLHDIHLKSLVDNLQRFYKVKKSKELQELEFLGSSGKPDSQWVILDFNDLIIHIMDKDLRFKYDFDNLFADYENYRYH